MKKPIEVKGRIDEQGMLRLTCRRQGVESFPFANLVVKNGPNSALIVTYGFDEDQVILHGDLSDLTEKLEDLL